MLFSGTIFNRAYIKPESLGKTATVYTADESGYCTVCDKPVSASEGILYELSSDGTYAEVIGYEGTAKRLVLADTYEGVPVTHIYEEAFRDSDITRGTIGNSVTSIGDDAFYYCTSLTSVTIPDSVTSIGNYAFRDCYDLASVTIGNSVKSIGEYAFAWCSSLTSVTIGNSVTSIGERAFYYCRSLASVYYHGTEAEWGEIVIGADNSNLTSATRYYYSEEAPTAAGNFWHYDGDGNIVVW